jgi:hypothetical protein
MYLALWMVCFFMRTWKLGWQGRPYLLWKEKEKGTDETSLRKTREGGQERKTLKKEFPNPLLGGKEAAACFHPVSPALNLRLPSIFCDTHLGIEWKHFPALPQCCRVDRSGKGSKLGAHLSFPNAQEPNSTPPALRQQRGVDQLAFSAPRSCKQTILAAQPENS